MDAVSNIHSASGVLFRAAFYILLRIIPSPIALVAVILFALAHITTVFFLPPTLLPDTTLVARTAFTASVLPHGPSAFPRALVLVLALGAGLGSAAGLAPHPEASLAVTDRASLRPLTLQPSRFLRIDDEEMDGALPHAPNSRAGRGLSVPRAGAAADCCT